MEKSRHSLSFSSPRGVLSSRINLIYRDAGLDDEVEVEQMHA